jgi:hypothetical protein
MKPTKAHRCVRRVTPLGRTAFVPRRTIFINALSRLIDISVFGRPTWTRRRRRYQ